MNSRDRVKKAIHFGGPDRVPILYFNADREESDIIVADVVHHFMGPRKDKSEWGFEWERMDGTMGQPKSTVLPDWTGASGMVLPDPRSRGRFDVLAKARAEFGADKYYLGAIALSGFTVMSFLRGFENVMTDFYTERAALEMLADTVFGFENAIIEQMAEQGADGVAFYDDWGTQENLFIPPKLWRDFFKPRYAAQFALAHEHGLDVYFHSCGMISDIIPDLIEAGVDMLNISQPNLYDIEALGRDYGGRVCFVCPVSYQTTAVTGTKEEIYRDAERLVRSFNIKGGGFIGYVEEYGSIGMSEQNYRYCVDAFRIYG